MGKGLGAFFKARLSGIDSKALVGSGCFWAWFDAGFMGAFSVGAGFDTLSAETVSLAGAVVQIAACAVILLFSPRFRRIVSQGRFIVTVGLAGSVASLISLVASFAACLPAAFLAQALRSLFVSFAIASWGGLYCREGSHSAMVYVTGGFALALAIDLALSVVVAPVSSVLAACLPLVAALLLARVDEPLRAYAPSAAASSNAGVPSVTQRSTKRLNYLGISPVMICGLALVMVGFGYTQCQVSLEAAAGDALVNGPVVIQLARGVVSVLLFVLALVAPQGMGAVSRAGLLVFIAGFSVMPFLQATDLLWASGMAVLCGYTVVDVLVWVLTAQAAAISSTDALRTVCIMRLLINCACQALGRVIGFVVFAVLPGEMSMPAVSLFGYFMTAGVVLLLSGRDIWELFCAEPPKRDARPVEEGQADRIASLAARCGLTQRESEVFGYLAQGRSKPWVATTLGISGSTVNTHVRSLYEKLGVSNRQDLLDLVVCRQSTTSNEGDDLLP